MPKFDIKELEEKIRRKLRGGTTGGSTPKGKLLDVARQNKRGISDNRNPKT